MSVKNREAKLLMPRDRSTGHGREGREDQEGSHNGGHKSSSSKSYHLAYGAPQEDKKN